MKRCLVSNNLRGVVTFVGRSDIRATSVPNIQRTKRMVTTEIIIKIKRSSVSMIVAFEESVISAERKATSLSIVVKSKAVQPLLLTMMMQTKLGSLQWLWKKMMILQTIH